jgi:hypothetical protein
MDPHHIPYEITGIIITKMNRNIICCFDDEILLRFVIKYSHIHPETLLTWFVKQQRKKALVLYTSIKAKEISYISDNVFILLCKIAIKNSNTDILKHLINVYLNVINNNTNVVYTIVNLLIEVYLKKECLKWITILKYFIRLPNTEYIINIRLLIKVLTKDKSKKLIKLLMKNKCIDIDISEKKVLNYIIIHNHLNLLKFLVVNGYQITLYDIIIGILSSNCKMMKYITMYLKPRLYTKGFRKMLLLLTTKRNNTIIYKYVYRRLK